MRQSQSVGLWLLTAQQKKMLKNRAALICIVCNGYLRLKIWYHTEWNRHHHFKEMVSHLLKSHVCKTTSLYIYAVAIGYWLGNLHTQVNLERIDMNHKFICSKSSALLRNYSCNMVIYQHYSCHWDFPNLFV